MINTKPKYFRAKLTKIINMNKEIFKCLALDESIIDDDKIDGDFYEVSIYKSSVCRPLTQKEIDDFELKLKAKKYNI